jgi:hypothetical protein
MWIRKEGEPPGEPGHNILYTVHTVAACPVCRQGQMEEYTHDCWSPPGEEDWDMYWWYLFDQKEIAFLRSLLVTCPSPLNPACDCRLHEDLRTSCEGLFSQVGYHHRRPHSPYPGLDAGYVPLTIEKQGNSIRLQPKV